MQTMTRNPSWWTREHDSAWDRIRDAFRRDWEQTKYDFGAGGRDLKQDIGDTIGQAVGTQTAKRPDTYDYDAYEPAYRFGYGARSQYGEAYPSWDQRLETQLRHDWESTYREPEYAWDQHREAIRRGWDYDHPDDMLPGNRVPGIQTGGRNADGSPDTRGIMEKAADAVTGDRTDDKTGKRV
jgi:hypothetical protein